MIVCYWGRGRCVFYPAWWNVTPGRLPLNASYWIVPGTMA